MSPEWAARLAVIRRVPPIVGGAVVLGFGTSSPELLVSSLASLRGEPEVAVGNIVGSNLANLSLILGVGAALLPLTIDSRTVRREVPLAMRRWRSSPLRFPAESVRARDSFR
jgi:cation:H+ antiporter